MTTAKEFFRGRLGTPEEPLESIRRACEKSRRDLRRAKDAVKCGEDSLNALMGLRQCERSDLMSNVHEHWLLVARYSLGTDARGGARPATVECVIIPGMAEDSYRHRPKPNEDPARAGRGVVTMTPTLAPGREIAASVAAEYGANVRLGTFDDALIEPCGSCGANALVICNHGWDYDSDCQWLRIHRLCLRCPRNPSIADIVLDVIEPLTLLPPARPPKRR